MSNEAPPGFVPAPFPPLLGQDGLPVHEPVAAPTNGRKKKGGRRGPRQPAAVKPAKNGRRKKKQRLPPFESAGLRGAVKSGRAAVASTQLVRTGKQPRAVKIDLAVAVAVMAALQPEDTNAFQNMIAMLQQLPAKARVRIVTALAKMVTA